MDIVIIDDEPLARQRLQRLVSELDHETVAEAANGEQAMAAILQYDPDIVLLDIEMPGENGLQVAEKIAALDAPPAIIFTTAYDQYALDAFGTLATGYLLKPIQKNQLEKVLEKAKSLNKLQLDALNQRNPEKRREHIVSKGHRGIELILIENIRFFTADQKYVMVHSTQGQVLIDEPLKELEKEFSHQFIRVHRNALVSVKHIQGLDRDQQGHYFVRLTDIDERPTVSRRYAGKIKLLLQTL